jgi:hypothetical protein
MYTDGLIEGKVGDDGPERLGSEGLISCLTEILPALPGTGLPGPQRDERLLDALVDRVRGLNGGDLDDDLAIFALACAAGPP